MRPGISIQHTVLPSRRYGLVRCDIAGIVGFIPEDHWPVDAVEGDFVELTLQRHQELLDHPLRRLFDAASRRAVEAFFGNGGDQCHLFGVCISNVEQLAGAASAQSVLEPFLERLRGEEDIALLAVPSAAYMPCTYSRSGEVRCQADTLLHELMRHCQLMNNRFLIIDAPQNLHGEALEVWLRGLRQGNEAHLAFGAVYYPWLKNGDERMPPSGSVLGVFARSERQHSPFGVAWPPANVSISGVTHTDAELRVDEIGRVTDAGANPIVIQPTRGVIIFGARTLSTEERWRFINARRIVSMVAEQLRRDNEWVVFETNDRSIWKVLERDVSTRLEEFWEAGLITGTGAQKNFLVRCDEETNPKEERNAGQLNVHVLIQPINTTEQITIDLRLGEGAV